MCSTNTQTHIIYAGGTFGCHGRPLNTLDKAIFLPNFAKLVGDKQSIAFLDNTIIKDSSTLTPADFIAFYQLIKDAHQQGATRFVLITGTDTLSYLAAFLSIGLSHLPICLVLTGSMLPLFDPDSPTLRLLTGSDAWDNLQNALAFINQHAMGVFISFNQQILHGDSSQKIHTSDKNAFVGTLANPQANARRYPKPSLINHDLCDIHTFYCTPNTADYLCKPLQNLLGSPPTAIILLGFGAGNIAFHPSLSDTLAAFIEQNFLVIISSSCPFGAVSDDYAVGAWQYQLGALSGGAIPMPTLYALALWVCLTSPTHKRYETWRTLTATFDNNQHNT